MKTLKYSAAVLALLGLGACSDMMGGGSSYSSRPVAATAPPVAPSMVKQVQSTLRDDGYYKDGPVDGMWGPGTESAVRSFQHDHNLNSSGQLDTATLQAMNIPNGSAPNTSAPATQPGNYNQPNQSDNAPPPANPGPAH